jgi:mitochondrial FAD-linked sulfhydryl oxidase
MLKTDKKGKDYYGSSMWTTMHVFAAAYDGSTKKAKAFIKYVRKIIPILFPCKTCADHWLQVLEEIPPENYLSNNHDLFFFTYIAHDRVNDNYNKHHPDKPKKISPDFNDCKIFYFKLLSAECADCQ